MTEHVETIFEGRYLSLVRRGTWEFVRRRAATGVVGIVAVTPEERLILVEQHRAPLDAPTIELPAGLAGDVAGSTGEPMAEAARRELIEETGYDAARLTLLGRGPSSAGLTDEVVDLFLAEGLRRVGPGGGDASEAITVHEIALAEAAGWLAARARGGALIDFKVWAGLHFLGVSRLNAGLD